MGPEKSQVWRTVLEKRRIVELTLQPGMSVARVVQAEDVNSHQVFQWRRAYPQGMLGDPATEPVSLLPVVVATSGKQIREHCIDPKPAGATGAIHIEFPGRAAITVESGANIDLLRTVLESLRP